MPWVSLLNVPKLGLAMELEFREKELWRTLRQAVEGICDQGVDFLALACPICHRFADSIREICGTNVELISVTDVVASWLGRLGIERINLLGSPQVRDLGSRSPFSDLSRDINIEPLDDKACERLDRLIVQVKREGPSEAALNHLRDILHSGVKAKVAVLASPELSLLVRKQRRKGRGSRILVDSLALHGEALACRRLGIDAVPASLTEAIHCSPHDLQGLLNRLSLDEANKKEGCLNGS